MIKRILHRVVILWCLCGLVKLCIFLNPLVFFVWTMVLPANDPPVLGNTEHVAILWLSSIIAFGVFAFACWALHLFSDWFFGTKK